LQALNQLTEDFIEASFGSTHQHLQQHTSVQNSLYKNRIQELCADGYAKDEKIAEQSRIIDNLKKDYDAMRRQLTFERENAIKMKEYNMIIQEKLSKERGEILKERESFAQQLKMLHNHVAALKAHCSQKMNPGRTVLIEDGDKMYKICDESVSGKFLY
jgi:hypothetical protein